MRRLLNSKGNSNMEKAIEPTVSFSLTVKDASSALSFYSEAFGAQELFRLPTPEGGVAHAEFMIGNSRIYISDESDEWHAFAMAEGTMASCLFSIAIEDCDRSYDRAIKAGAESLSEPLDQFWGTRSALVKDPFGYRWCLVQKIEDVSPEELANRAQALFSS
jgi:PhnB protein